MKKPTLATVKSFIRKNSDRLLICSRAAFDGMSDSTVYDRNPGFRKVEFNPEGFENTLGVPGAWFVFGSRDLITPYQRNGLVGFEIYNCCGVFVLAVEE